MNPIKSLAISLCLCAAALIGFSSLASAAKYGSIHNLYVDSCVSTKGDYIATAHWSFAKPYGHNTYFTMSVNSKKSQKTTENFATFRPKKTAKRSDVITVRAYVDGKKVSTKTINFTGSICH